MFMKHIFALIAIFMASLHAYGQVAVKTNLLYDATTTPNIGAEMRVGSQSTVNLVYGLNAWTFNTDNHGDRKAKHWLLMPEYRWWPCTTFSGHFFGVHAMGGQMNFANVDIPFPGAFFGGKNLAKAVKDTRVQGGFAGVGLTYGYQHPLSRHWNIEAEIGVGYGHVWYDQFPCEVCGTKLASGGSNYVGITKIGFSVMYLF